MAKTFCFLKWRLENWEERRLRSVPNIHPSHVCLKEKKCLLMFFNCGLLLPLHSDGIKARCCSPLEIGGGVLYLVLGFFL